MCDKIIAFTLRYIATVAFDFGSPNNVIREEVTRYMKEKLSPQIVDPLEFWQRNHKLYPNLSKLVRVYLCPPPSTVASERAFKVEKNVVGDNRVRLRPDNLEMNLFLKYNLRALNYDLNNLESPPADFRPLNTTPHTFDFVCSYLLAYLA